MKMKETHARLACAIALMTAVAPVLAGCDEPVAARASTIFEPEVGVITVSPRRMPMVRELPGRIAPTRVADVRAQVSGIVVERLFQQGTEVRAGTPLYRIDPRP